MIELQGLGHVVVEVARLEYLLAELTAIARDQGDDYIDTIVKSWGKTRTAYVDAVNELPDAVAV